MPSSATPQFDNESKPLDRERPFHRIHYKDFDASGTRPKPDGVGVTCGCTNKEDFPEIKKLLDPDHYVNQGVANDIIKSLIGPVDVALTLLGKLPFGIGAKAAEIFLKAVKDAWDKIIGKTLPKALRAIPSWSPVRQGSRNDIVDASQVVEVEGFVTRCYQNASDVPFFQWHHWYNWSIHIRPEQGYEWVAADTTNPPSTKDFDDDDPKDEDDMQRDEHPVTQNKSIECQWDPGALYADQRLFETDIPTDIDNSSLKQKAEAACGPMFGADWCWPMTGGYAWASGRWVYDCGKSTEPKGDEKPRNCTMLNPCKAIACARWEAFKFPENQGAVPAIQFMFFTSKRGGYIDHERITDVDYEFIVDLPALDLKPTAPFPIGHTAAFPDGDPPPFPHNTIVLRPRLLKHFNTGAFLPAGTVQNPPIVEVIPPGDPSQAPKQVKVTIPLSTMGAINAYGVIISLGWHDPLNQQAEKVRSCTINFGQIVDRQVERNTPSKDIQPIQEALVGAISAALGDMMAEVLFFLPDPIKEKVGDFLGAFIKLVIGGLGDLADELVDLIFKEGELWLVRIGVNGRWFAFFRHADASRTIPVNLHGSVQVLLGEHDRLSVSVSGAEIDRVGKVMFRARQSRLLRFAGPPVTEFAGAPNWKQIAESDHDFRDDLFVRYVLDLLLTFGLDNEPLGFIDAQIDPGLQITDGNRKYPEAKDPIWMDDQPHAFGTNASKLGPPSFALLLNAKEAHSVGGPQCVYVEKADNPDYVLDCGLSVEAQNLPDD